MPRMNGEWTIEDAIRLNFIEEVVLAKRWHPYNGYEYVTWCCMNGNNYFWGHDYFDEETARLDLLERAKERIKT